MAETGGGGGRGKAEVETESGGEFWGALRERTEEWGRGSGEKAGGDGHWFR